MKKIDKELSVSRNERTLLWKPRGGKMKEGNCRKGQRRWKKERGRRG